MTFWWGDDLGDFFIKGFQINSALSMTLLCICLFILSASVEGLKVRETNFLDCISSILFNIFRYTELAHEQKLHVKNRDRFLARPVKMPHF